LELQVPEITPSFIKYLKASIPAGSLNKLWIMMTEIDLYDWMRNIGLEAALDFAHYLSSFSTVRLATFPDKGYQRQP
jgi:hypothetical protein